MRVVVRTAWIALLSLSSWACAPPPASPAAPEPVRVPSGAPAPSPDRSERHPSTGRIEGVYLVDDGVLAALNAEELASIERCHLAGRPLGWVLLRVRAEGGIEAVEAEGVLPVAADCARSGLSPRERLGEVLVYLRFL